MNWRYARSLQSFWPWIGARIDNLEVTVKCRPKTSEFLTAAQAVYVFIHVHATPTNQLHTDEVRYVFSPCPSRLEIVMTYSTLSAFAGRTSLRGLV